MEASGSVKIFTIYLFCGVIASCYAVQNGEYIVTHTPSHVSFKKEAESILTTDIPKVISSTYGFSLAKDLKWNGLAGTSLFTRPKANVVVSVDGTPRTLNIKHHARYNTEEDEASVVSTESVVDRLQSNIEAKPLIVDFSLDNSLFDIKSAHPGLFDSLPVTFNRVRTIFQSGQSSFSPMEMGSLNMTEDRDVLFLGELYVMRKMISTLRSNPEMLHDNVPDFFHFNVAGLRYLVEHYGKSSLQVRDALNLLEKVIDEVTAEFRGLYSDNVVIQVVTSSASEEPRSGRKTRSLLQSEGGEKVEGQAAANNGTDLGIGEVYTDMYPFIFNVLLWGGIIYALVIIAIAYGIWNMDPGRDSIIYRMTSQRMKKD